MRTIQAFLGTIAFTIIGLASPVAGAADPDASKAAERAAAAFDRQQALQQRRDLHRSLVAEQVLEARLNAISVPVSADEQSEIDSARREVPERVGLTKNVSIDVSFEGVDLRGRAGLVQALGNGAVKAMNDGGFVYTSLVNSPGATALRIHFAGVRLPDNASLYLYAADGQVFGPYTGPGPHGNGQFWSHTVMGEEVTVQLRLAGPASAADLRSARLQIVEVAHLRPRFMGGACSYNAECVVNLACAVNVNEQAIGDARNAVAEMQWIISPYIYICSGGLLADLDTSSKIPYFITANHCISQNTAASTLETFFQLTQSTCSANCDDIFATRANHPQQLRVLGATVKSTSATSDYTLLRLNSAAPAGSTFLGWDANPVAFMAEKDLFRISHPSGAPQSYSTHAVDTTAGTCGVWPRGKWIYSQDRYGATEGGSSGSPVVSADGKVVGQLSGACGWVDERGVCDWEHKSTVDGAFAAYYPAIKKFLLLPSGATCTSNGECASGSCTTKRGKRTCR